MMIKCCRSCLVSKG